MHPCPVSICPEIQQGVTIFQPVPLITTSRPTTNVEVVMVLVCNISRSIRELKHHILSIRTFKMYI